MTESAHDALITTDADGRIRSWNSATTRLFGYTAEEALGQPLVLIIPERFDTAHANGLRRVAAKAPAQALWVRAHHGRLPQGRLRDPDRAFAVLLDHRSRPLL